MVQQLYVLSKLGKTEEAERLASDIELQEYVHYPKNAIPWLIPHQNTRLLNPPNRPKQPPHLNPLHKPLPLPPNPPNHPRPPQNRHPLRLPIIPPS